MLINSIKEHAPDSEKKKFSDFCPTRWVEKVTGLDEPPTKFSKSGGELLGKRG